MLNKLWALPTNESTLAMNKKYPHFYSCADHCLIIAKEKPENSMEVNEEIQKLLSAEEWQWIYSVRCKLWEEEEKQYGEQLEWWAKKFSEKFLSECRKEVSEDDTITNQCGEDVG